MAKAVFYHAGCPVCVSAEQDLLTLIPEREVDVVHLGSDRSKIETAEKAGVRSVPALVLPNGNVLHINFGASIADLK
ncbi:thioredoxin family protein [Chitinophaga solisilvae]|uniref:Thioredoxin family protein n=1 Tax=Chitinophaga solisilvae TaxID=1233460 RepID=A0A433WBN8_9BACT|nr:thioredoxin family protein [Chitinophaga solisilvae]NSL87628.1 thioredoxin family protein [Chitinophaga solisilvae]